MNFLPNLTKLVHDQLCRKDRGRRVGRREGRGAPAITILCKLGSHGKYEHCLVLTPKSQMQKKQNYRLTSEQAFQSRISV
jgi:hypothetical protein